MSEALSTIFSGAAGLALGLIFFGGLWWTVRNGIHSKYAPIWFFLSLPVRMGIVLAGIFLVNGGRWDQVGHLDRLGACLVGLFVARPLVLWLTRGEGELPVNLPKESNAS